MSTYDTLNIHSQLAHAVRAAALIREEIAAGSCSLLGRIVRRVKYAWLMSSIDTLTVRLRGRF